MGPMRHQRLQGLQGLQGPQRLQGLQGPQRLQGLQRHHLFNIPCLSWDFLAVRRLRTPDFA